MSIFWDIRMILCASQMVSTMVFSMSLMTVDYSEIVSVGSISKVEVKLSYRCIKNVSICDIFIGIFLWPPIFSLLWGGPPTFFKNLQQSSTIFIVFRFYFLTLSKTVRSISGVGQEPLLMRHWLGNTDQVN